MDRPQRTRSNQSEPPPNSRCGRLGFTLLEILVVVAIIAVLAALLLPALSKAKSKGKRITCSNHLRQLAIAAQMYAADNDGKLAENVPSFQPGFATTNVWIRGNMKSENDATNQNFLRQGKLFPYANQVTVYHCPSDLTMTNRNLRVRSYSMNGWMGGRYMETDMYQRGYRTFVRDSELAVAGPSRLWMIVDEHEATLDDGFFNVTMDDSRPFDSHPASRHENAYGLNFGDGHVEVYKLRDPDSAKLIGNAAFNTDWIRLKQVTTIR